MAARVIVLFTCGLIFVLVPAVSPTDLRFEFLQASLAAVGAVTSCGLVRRAPLPLRIVGAVALLLCVLWLIRYAIGMLGGGLWPADA
jgi:hypothetical protein